MQLDLFSTPARQRQLEVAIDELAEHFGTNVVHCANDLNNPRPVATLDFLDDRILISSWPCPLWVISRHYALRGPCPLSPQKQTFASVNSMSAKCQ
jgi:hypothetical protein